MMIKETHLNEEDDSICLQIIQQPSIDSTKLNDPGGSFFEPRTEGNNRSSPTPCVPREAGSQHRNYWDKAPEKKLTLFALNVAILEKAASGLGALGFIWATVVLLGGFASSLEKKDFWVVTLILITEGTRIFSRSHELEWQHQRTWTIADAGKQRLHAIASSSRLFIRAIKAIFQQFSAIKLENQQQKQITEDIQMITQTHVLPHTRQQAWTTFDVPLILSTNWVFLSKIISRALYWLQLLSAVACMILSLMRLVQQDYGEIQPETKNRKPALDLFYGLALGEALMFLLEKAYWEWNISVCKLLEQVNQECDLGTTDIGIVPIKRFFYDAYSRCINGSVFDSLKMDLVSFAGELLDSDFHDEQLTGLQILQKFANSDRFSSDTLRKIGTLTSVMERLIEMLSWENPANEKIRRSAAEVVSKLAGKKQNALRVAGIPASIECISSLLYTGRKFDNEPYEIWERNIVADQTNYDFSAFNLLGLLILKNLSDDHENCWKIGNTRGLLSKIIDFTTTGERLLRNDPLTESQIKAVKRSLQVVKKLVSTTGETGKMLRQEISNIVFTVSNIRDILEYGENHILLQMQGIEILTSLAMDQDAREKIGSTGGVLRLLLSIFFKPRLTEDQNKVSVEAGETLALLTLNSKQNANCVLKQMQVVDQLVDTLTDPVLQINSSRILRNLCACSGSENFLCLRGVTEAAPTVLHSLMVKDSKLLQESIGLTTQIFRFMTPEEHDKELKRACISATKFAKRLLEILEKYNAPCVKFPRIRRFVVELVIWLMKSHEQYKQLFKKFEMDRAIKSVAETTSKLECFPVFSGSIGLNRHDISLSSLADVALELLMEYAK
ncbi:Armadillo-like helical-containing protein [Dioscorea alata]|uniref:Armadillo-like helical-containing protein n=2 Tax=Dioscorea alata TaxID=55571 RepID=A0ACB7VQL8_DIOAL|nr:Armadillo-like helical-containing protein [Dioscorea alata]KAH7676931.1 Armadillo-like helical-containing protein [Dioscorea alata]